MEDIVGQETSFAISVPDSVIERLQQKLALADFPDELEESGHDYGVPLADIRRLVERWRGGYDWRVHEARLNETLPQFKRKIGVEGFGALETHYVHKKSARVDAIPLLFIHGWPGSFIEVEKILEPLSLPTSTEDPAFHVVAIGLPGFGFSEGPKKKGFRGSQYAEICNMLMLSLGYNEYVVQGGDWGAYIGRKLALDYSPTHCKAWHTNYASGEPPKLLSSPFVYLKHLLTPYTAAEQAGIKRGNWFNKVGKGYNVEQSTQPQTLGYSLTDSPVGLLAWVYEKLVNWTDEYPWTDDEVLTWVSIYQFSLAGPTASTRIYYEVNRSWERSAESKTPTFIPMGASHFPKELRRVPRSWTESVNNLVFTSEHDRGGHFAAHERPEELVADLRQFFGKGGTAYSVVGGKSGYDA